MADKRVFFSYSWDDRAFADELRQAMAEHHVHVWDPASDLAVGSEIPDIKKTLTNSDLFVYIIPEKEGSGKGSLLELGAAKALGKRIIAVLPDSGRVANSAVAARLADLLVVNEGRRSPKDIVKKILERAA
jgi:TIR domain-containing protein